MKNKKKSTDAAQFSEESDALFGQVDAKVRRNEFVWKVDTPSLLKEIMNNPCTEILKIPLNIFQGILTQIAIRAIELDDKELNKLMIRLALYDGAHSKKMLDYLNT